MAKRRISRRGILGNMNNLMKQAQRLQRQMEEKTKELEEDLGSRRRRRSCESNRFREERNCICQDFKGCCRSDDVEMLEDLIVAATNEASYHGAGKLKDDEELQAD